MRRRQIRFPINSSRWESLLVLLMGQCLHLHLRLVCNSACVSIYIFASLLTFLIGLWNDVAGTICNRTVKHEQEICLELRIGVYAYVERIQLFIEFSGFFNIYRRDIQEGGSETPTWRKTKKESKYFLFDFPPRLTGMSSMETYKTDMLEHYRTHFNRLSISVT